ncbi:hypothetical protein M408DRAFT_329507 [Serendipita vermifera MAFF 305830]|uniref:Rho-GAP domain-containing protein n=1 Tax=Serendipita vermifera MAFF 305830 TaxID=933852 RepID=A0A0C2WQH6_SERVB|nr:hypothetical protein M408DRAFT_329507 [Serendipita vermifera MAFF 305830]
MSRPNPISTTLRQKLSSLASPVAPSFSSRPATFSPTSMGPAKKRGLLASWLRANTEKDDDTSSARPGSSSSGKGKEREWDAGELNEEMQRIMNAVIFNGGLDFETRPMVVVTAAALPDPSHVNYDLLLQLILSYLDLYVEADYCVVFLAAGGRYSPGWSWIWKAYRSLNRKYRKNLKKLYIVHSTGFTKMLFSLAGAIISPKFYSKIEYVSTLSELAIHVPLAQMNIHPAVYSENLKYEREITLPAAQQPASRIFGASLDELMGLDGESGGIPRPIRDAAEYLRSDRRDGLPYLEEHGLFRRSPSSALLKQVQGSYDRGLLVNLSQFGDANLAAVLIKKFFRSLPEPIFPDSMFATIRKCPDPDVLETRDDAVDYIRDKILGELEGNKQLLLNYVFHLLHDVSARSEINLMDGSNLAIVFTPNLVSNENPLKAVEMSMVASTYLKSKDIMETAGRSSSHANVVNLPEGSKKQHTGTTLGTVVRVCIERYYEIFDEVRDVTEAISPVEFEEGIGGKSRDSPVSSRRELSPGRSQQQQQSAPASTPAPAHKYQGRVRGRQGPPPSAASASMALLAKALAEGTTPNEHQAFLDRSNGAPRSYTEPDALPDHVPGSFSQNSLLANRAPSVSMRSGVAGSAGPSGWTGGRVLGVGGKPKTRSIISIDRSGATIGGHMDGSGRESIKLGRGTVTSAGTVRKSASAGVVGVGVTANGFFTSPH